MLKVRRDWLPDLYGQEGPYKKVAEVLAPADPNPPLAEFVISVSSVMGMPATSTGVVKPPIGSILRPPFPEMPLPTTCAVAEKE